MSVSASKHLEFRLDGIIIASVSVCHQVLGMSCTWIRKEMPLENVVWNKRIMTLVSGYSCVCCESPLFVSPLFTDVACFQIAVYRLTDVCEIPVNQLGGAGFCRVGWDSAVGRATGYGPDGLGVKSRYGRDFPQPHRPALGPTQASSPGVKRPGRGVDHPPPSSAEVKERVQPYIYSPAGPSWPFLR